MEAFVFTIDKPGERERYMEKRREHFVKVICPRSGDELRALFERPTAPLDLELAGFENETDYKDVISEVIKQKDLHEPEVMRKRIKRALDSIRVVREHNKTDITPAMDGFLARIEAELSGATA